MRIIRRFWFRKIQILGLKRDKLFTMQQFLIVENFCVTNISNVKKCLKKKKRFCFKH